MPQTILILGATSAIAQATAHQFAARGANLYLASRDMTALARCAQDLIARYNITVHYAKFDAEDFASHPSFFQQIFTHFTQLDGVLLAFGCLGESPLSHFTTTIARNFTGAVSILNCCAEYFSAQKHGFIIGIGSVAGDRGRSANFIYGPAKAGLTAYLQGLRQHLAPLGVRVITIKPGFVDTPMTFGRKGMFLVATPQYVARSIINALDKSREVIYTPWFWRYIMLVIKLIPEKIFKRLSL